MSAGHIALIVLAVWVGVPALGFLATVVFNVVCDARTRRDLRCYSDEDLSGLSDRKLLAMYYDLRVLAGNRADVGVIEGATTRRLNALDRLLDERFAVHARSLVA